MHAAKHQCRNSNIPAEEAHQFHRGLDCPRRAQRQSDKAEVDKVKTDDEQMVYRCRQFGIMAETADQIDFAIGAKRPRDPDRHADRDHKVKAVS